MIVSTETNNFQTLLIRNLHGQPVPEIKKKDMRNYRSENFSTTRTLSPRTVIGIGTTLS
jgi:hypothetical protein